MVSRYRKLQVSCCVVTVATTDFVKHWELYPCVDTYGRLLDELGTCLSFDCLSNTVHNAWGEQKVWVLFLVSWLLLTYVAFCLFHSVCSD